MTQTSAPQAPRPRVSIIAAVARNGVIGHDNAMPWHLSDDLKRFRALTTGHPIIMGRRTYESLGRPLPGRRNIVISRDSAFAAPGCEVLPALDAALVACSDASEVFIIGGAQLYAATLALADRLQITEIHADFDGDTHFPQYDRRLWRETAREHGRGEADFAYDFVTYERTPVPP
jgi:dihydrofolate reductase